MTYDDLSARGPVIYQGPGWTNLPCPAAAFSLVIPMARSAMSPTTTFAVLRGGFFIGDNMDDKPTIPDEDSLVRADDAPPNEGAEIVEFTPRKRGRPKGYAKSPFSG